MCEISDHRNKFTQQEDERLIMLIKENGAKRWKSIARKMSGKTARQCRDRYMNYLREGLGNRPWTDDEDFLLSQKVKEIGTHWSKIVIFFKGRSTNNIKNRWYTFHLKKKVKPKINNNIQNFNNFSNLQTFQQQHQHQLNQMQPQFNQFLFNYNYPTSFSGQNYCQPSCSLCVNNGNSVNYDYYYSNSDFNIQNYQFNINSSPNIEENSANVSPCVSMSGQSLLNISDQKPMEIDKNDSDISSLLNYEISDKKIKRIPSIFELLNPVST